MGRPGIRVEVSVCERERLASMSRLYLGPPTNALVCVDEKNQCQALECTQPVLPMGLGNVEGVTHEYIRHGTTTLLAALTPPLAKSLRSASRDTGTRSSSRFSNHIDKAVPAALDVHLMVDNYATHKHPNVKPWLAQRPRYHMHFTPTYSSWLNQVER